MIRGLLDQGLPRSTCRLLVKHGWDVVHVGEVGLAAATDAAILEYARRERRVCVTLDADFHALLATSAEPGPSTIRIRIEGLKAAQLADLLVGAWSKIASAMATGAMVTITDRAVRVKKLPVAKR